MKPFGWFFLAVIFSIFFPILLETINLYSQALA
jgi:hypothetical protein